MANATASKPAKKPDPKQPPRRPPQDSVWVRYHPWMEGALSQVASTTLHVLVLGVLVLWSMAYAWGFFKHNSSLPVEPVQFVDAGGGGDPNGSGDDAGKHAPLKEGVESDKPSTGNSTDTNDRPHFDEIEAKRVALEFPPEDARRIQEGPESMKKFADLDKEFRDKLRDGINPSKGNGGTGKDGGKDKGTGTGTGTGNGAGTGRVLNEREKRMLRWSMQFDTRDGVDYLHQLESLGAILAIPAGGEGSFKVIRELSKPRPPLLDEDLSQIQRIWWIDDNPRSVQSLMTAMGLNLQPSRVVAFIPPELEDELAQKELAFKGLKEDQIFETKFRVVPGGGSKRYDVRVIDQKAK